MNEHVAMDVAALVAEHYAAVYRYAYRLTGQVAEAEDITQQVFLAAQRKGGQLRDANAARPWLFAILRNAFLAARRQTRATAPAGGLAWDDLPEHATPPSEIDPELLQQALNSLPEEFRLIVLMYYFEEYSYREIAERLDIPVGTVMSRLSRAKGILREGIWGSRLKSMLAGKG